MEATNSEEKALSQALFQLHTKHKILAWEHTTQQQEVDLLKRQLRESNEQLRASQAQLRHSRGNNRTASHGEKVIFRGYEDGGTRRNSTGNTSGGGNQSQNNSFIRHRSSDVETPIHFQRSYDGNGYYPIKHDVRYAVHSAHRDMRYADMRYAQRVQPSRSRSPYVNGRVLPHDASFLSAPNCGSPLVGNTSVVGDSPLTKNGNESNIDGTRLVHGNGVIDEEDNQGENTVEQQYVEFVKSATKSTCADSKEEKGKEAKASFKKISAQSAAPETANPSPDSLTASHPLSSSLDMFLDSQRAKDDITASKIHQLRETHEKIIQDYQKQYQKQKDKEVRVRVRSAIERFCMLLRKSSGSSKNKNPLRNSRILSGEELKQLKYEEEKAKKAATKNPESSPKSSSITQKFIIVENLVSQNDFWLKRRFLHSWKMFVDHKMSVQEACERRLADQKSRHSEQVTQLEKLLSKFEEEKTSWKQGKENMEREFAEKLQRELDQQREKLEFDFKGKLEQAVSHAVDESAREVALLKDSEAAEEAEKQHERIKMLESQVDNLRKMQIEERERWRFETEVLESANQRSNLFEKLEDSSSWRLQRESSSSATALKDRMFRTWKSITSVKNALRSWTAQAGRRKQNDKQIVRWCFTDWSRVTQWRSRNLISLEAIVDRHLRQKMLFKSFMHWRLGVEGTRRQHSKNLESPSDSPRKALSSEKFNLADRTMPSGVRNSRYHIAAPSSAAKSSYGTSTPTLRGSDIKPYHRHSVGNSGRSRLAPDYSQQFVLSQQWGPGHHEAITNHDVAAVFSTASEQQSFSIMKLVAVVSRARIRILQGTFLAASNVLQAKNMVATKRRAQADTLNFRRKLRLLRLGFVGLCHSVRESLQLKKFVRVLEAHITRKHVQKWHRQASMLTHSSLQQQHTQLKTSLDSQISNINGWLVEKEKARQQATAKTLLVVWRNGQTEVRARQATFFSTLALFVQSQRRRKMREVFYHLKLSGTQLAFQDLERSCCILAGLERLRNFVTKKDNAFKSTFIFLLRTYNMSQGIREMDASFQREMKQLNKENKDLKDQVDNATKRMSEDEKGRYDQLENVRKEADTVISRLRNEIDEQARQYNALQTDNENFKHQAQVQLAEIQVAISREKESLFEQMEHYKSEKHATALELKQVEEKCVELTERNAFLTEENGNLARDGDSYKLQLQRFAFDRDQEILNIENDKRKLQEELLMKSQTVQELECQHMRLEHEAKISKQTEFELRSSLERYCNVQEVAQTKVLLEEERLQGRIKALEVELNAEKELKDKEKEVKILLEQEAKKKRKKNRPLSSEASSANTSVNQGYKSSRGIAARKQTIASQTNPSQKGMSKQLVNTNATPNKQILFTPAEVTQGGHTNYSASDRNFSRTVRSANQNIINKSHTGGVMHGSTRSPTNRKRSRTNSFESQNASTILSDIDEQKPYEGTCEEIRNSTWDKRRGYDDQSRGKLSPSRRGELTDEEPTPRIRRVDMNRINDLAKSRERSRSGNLSNASTPMKRSESRKRIAHPIGFGSSQPREGYREHARSISKDSVDSWNPRDGHARRHGSNRPNSRDHSKELSKTSSVRSSPTRRGGSPKRGRGNRFQDDNSMLLESVVPARTLTQQLMMSTAHLMDSPTKANSGKPISPAKRRIRSKSQTLSLEQRRQRRAMLARGAIGGAELEDSMKFGQITYASPSDVVPLRTPNFPNGSPIIASSGTTAVATTASTVDAAAATTSISPLTKSIPTSVKSSAAKAIGSTTSSKHGFQPKARLISSKATPGSGPGTQNLMKSGSIGSVSHSLVSERHASPLNYSLRIPASVKTGVGGARKPAVPKSGSAPSAKTNDSGSRGPFSGKAMVSRK